jgi:phospholipase A1/A2
MNSGLIIAAALNFSLSPPALEALASIMEETIAPFQDGQQESIFSAEPRDAYPDLDTLNALYQPYSVNISTYEPIYLLVGTDPRMSKLQISFKYRIFNPEGSMGSMFPWLMPGFHLGYTQTSFWDLQSVSVPFDDISYKPELFFISPNIKPRFAWMEGLFVQTGFQHESNGRSGEESRSTNFLYIRPITIFHKPGTQPGLQLGVKIWTYVYNSEKKNPDLKEYRGIFELDGKMGRADGWVLGSTLRWASKGPSVTFDLTYPLHKILRDNLDFYFQIQYADVLAESLLDYQQRTKVLRLGIAIVR